MSIRVLANTFLNLSGRHDLGIQNVWKSKNSTVRSWHVSNSISHHWVSYNNLFCEMKELVSDYRQYEKKVTRICQHPIVCQKYSLHEYMPPWSLPTFGFLFQASAWFSNFTCIISWSLLIRFQQTGVLRKQGTLGCTAGPLTFNFPFVNIWFIPIVANLKWSWGGLPCFYL